MNEHINVSLPANHAGIRCRQSITRCIFRSQFRQNRTVSYSSRGFSKTGIMPRSDFTILAPILRSQTNFSDMRRKPRVRAKSLLTPITDARSVAAVRRRDLTQTLKLLAQNLRCSLGLSGTFLTIANQSMSRGGCVTSCIPFIYIFTSRMMFCVYRFQMSVISSKVRDLCPLSALSCGVWAPQHCGSAAVKAILVQSVLDLSLRN